MSKLIKTKPPKKVTKGFLATKDGKLASVKVSIHDTGFYIVIEETDEPPRQLQRKHPASVESYIQHSIIDYTRSGYSVKELGHHPIKLNKNTGMFKVKI